MVDCPPHESIAQHAPLNEPEAQARNASVACLPTNEPGAQARIAETTITSSHLMNLQVGDRIVTERAAGSNVVLCVEKEKSFLANIGKFKGQRALKVVRAVQEGDRV